MKLTNFNKNIRNEAAQNRGTRGFSLTEIMIVLVVVSILTAISLPYVLNFKRAYKSEDQSLKIMDLMREAGQLALTKRRTFRLEIDLTDNKLLIIDEDTTVSPAVHREIKAIPLESVANIRMDVAPSGITRPNPPNYNDAVFASDTTGHKRGTTTVTGHSVWAARFKRDGSVVKADNTPVSATLFVWSPLVLGSANARNSREVRAVTIFGGTGAVRYWKYNGTAFQPY